MAYQRDGPNVSAVQQMLVAGGAVGDPYYANVSLLLHCDGVNGGTTFTDNSPSPKTLTVNGTVQTNTSVSKFGGSSLRTGTSPANSRLSVGSSGIRLFANEAWTLEFWINFDSVAAFQYFAAAAYVIGQPSFWIYTPTSGKLNAYIYGTTFTFDASILSNTWHFVSITNNGLQTSTSCKFFLDGILVSSKNLTVGPNQDIGWDIGGVSPSISSGASPRVWIDEFRITQGVARYTSNFTPPTAPFPNY